LLFQKFLQKLYPFFPCLSTNFFQNLFANFENFINYSENVFKMFYSEVLTSKCFFNNIFLKSFVLGFSLDILPIFFVSKLLTNFFHVS
jgi:hypothetical protein